MTNPIKAKNQHEWHELSFEEHILDSENNWPSGTIAAISKALQLNLNRKCEWKYKSSKPSQKQSQFTKEAFPLKTTPVNFKKDLTL